MTTFDREARREAWTKYWATGTLHSCSTSFQGNYAGAIGDCWREAFAALPRGGRVLDVGTGNGPLPKLLLDVQGHRGVFCDAVDLASVSPAWVGELALAMQTRVRFHSAVQAEHLPFDAARFDLVVSQFGLEYSDLSQSLAELARVLRPHGAVRLVVHHSQSVSARLAAEELRHIDWLVAEDGLLSVAQRMLGPMSQAATAQGRLALQHDVRANHLRDRFNMVQDELERRLKTSICPDVLEEARVVVADALVQAGQHSTQHGQARLSGFAESLTGSRLRLVELLAAALGVAGVESLLAGLSIHGIEATATALQERGEILGWQIQGTKKGGLTAPSSTPA